MAEWGTQLGIVSQTWSGATGVDTIVANAGDVLVVSVSLAVADAPVVSIVSDLDGAFALEQFEGVDDCVCMGWLELSTNGTHTITVTPTDGVSGYNAAMSVRRVDTNALGFQFDATAGFQGKDVTTGATSTDTDAITPNDSPCLYETQYARGPFATSGDVDWDGETIHDGHLFNSLLQATATSTLHTTGHANSANRRAVAIGAFLQDSSGVALTPSPVTVPIVLPAPTIGLGVLNMAPTSVAMPIVLPAPTIGLGVLDITPAAVTVPIVLPAPAVLVGGIQLAPTPLAIPLTLPAPVLGFGVLALIPDSVLVPIVLPAPVIGLGGTDITPAPIALPLVLPAPTIGLGDLPLSPASVVLTLVLPLPTIVGGGQAVVLNTRGTIIGPLTVGVILGPKPSN